MHAASLGAFGACTLGALQLNLMAAKSPPPPRAAEVASADVTEMMEMSRKEVQRRENGRLKAVEQLELAHAKMAIKDYKPAIKHYLEALKNLPESRNNWKERAAAMSGFRDASLELAKVRASEGRYFHKEGQQLESAEDVLNALLEKALRFVRHDITKSDIKVVKHLAEGLPEAIVDPTKIEQAFINLITNACHAMPGGGTLTVTTRERIITAAESPRHDSGDRSGIRFRPGEPVITIEIRDTGVGVAPEKLSRIFEPFFTTKSTGKGTGLGLSVTQKIVDLHRGKISIENHPEGGVIASITLKAIKQGDDARKERP